MKQEDGVWRTIRGRRVFIRKGESATDALNRSIADENEKKKAEQIAQRKEAIDTQTQYQRSLHAAHTELTKSAAGSHTDAFTQAKSQGYTRSEAYSDEFDDYVDYVNKVTDNGLVNSPMFAWWLFGDKIKGFSSSRDADDLESILKYLKTDKSAAKKIDDLIEHGQADKVTDYLAELRAKLKKRA